MSPKLYEMADKSMDPLGVIFLFAYVIQRKFTGVELTQDELLLGFIALGSVRVLWEKHRRRRGRGQPEVPQN